MPETPSHPELARAAEVMRVVRERCVWTQSIDHAALAPYLVEESAEVLDAIEGGSRAELREELGDLLWQVLFHAEVAASDADEPFGIEDVAGDLAEKMIRRHPHVFAGEVAETPEQVLVHWNAAKAAEKRARRSVLDGIPRGMPALARAQKVLGRAAGMGVDAEKARDASDPEEALGDALLDLVARARALGLDAEGVLRRRTARLEDEVRAHEAARAPKHPSSR